MKAVVLLSGGLDSCVLLSLAVEAWGSEEILALNLSYGQKHAQELRAAQNIASTYGVEYQLSRLNPELLKGGALTDGSLKIPETSYEEIEGVSPTYVPFRNGVFLSLATAVALQREANLVAYGAHSEDAADWAYPDCTPEFIGAMSAAIYVGTYHKVRLWTPLQHLKKIDIVQRAVEMDAPIHLTRSCYSPHNQSCGKCPTCLSRLAAFDSLGYEDPIVYEEGV